MIRNNPNVEWNWDNISSSISLEEIKNNIDNPKWNWNGISMNPNLTWEFIRNNLNRLNWYYISKLSIITLDIIQNNPNCPWDWSGISCNPNITWEFIKNNLDKDWDWSYISKLSIIDWNIVLGNPFIPWDFNEISNNGNITYDIIIKYILYPFDDRGNAVGRRFDLKELYKDSTNKNVYINQWNITKLSRSILITPNHIRENKIKFDYESLSSNRLLYDDNILHTFLVNN